MEDCRGEGRQVSHRDTETQRGRQRGLQMRLRGTYFGGEVFGEAARGRFGERGRGLAVVFGRVPRALPWAGLGRPVGAVGLRVSFARQAYKAGLGRPFGVVELAWDTLLSYRHLLH